MLEQCGHDALWCFEELACRGFDKGSVSMLISLLCIGTAGTSPPKCHHCYKSEGRCRADTESWDEGRTLDSRRRPLLGSRSHTPSAYTSPNLTMGVKINKYDCYVSATND